MILNVAIEPKRSIQSIGKLNGDQRELMFYGFHELQANPSIIKAQPHILFTEPSTVSWNRFQFAIEKNSGEGNERSRGYPKKKAIQYGTVANLLSTLIPLWNTISLRHKNWKVFPIDTSICQQICFDFYSFRVFISSANIICRNEILTSSSLVIGRLNKSIVGKSWWAVSTWEAKWKDAKRHREIDSRRNILFAIRVLSKADFVYLSDSIQNFYLILIIHESRDFSLR